LAQNEVVVCPDCDVRTIAKGIELCPDFGTVIVKAGIYLETGLKIDRPMTLQGEKGAIIDAEEKGDILFLLSDSVIVRNLEFRNIGVSYVKDWGAIIVDKAQHFRIENNVLTNTFFGIIVKNSKNGIVANNRVRGEAVEEISSGNAIHLWYCSDMTIRDNRVTHHRDGIYFEFVDNSLIEGNYSAHNVRYGLHFMFSNNDRYLDNVFEKNGSGVAVMFSKDIEMSKNQFLRNWGPASYGLLLKDITDSFIENNRFEENTTAIYAEGATRVSVKENHFVANGYALKMLGSSMENEVRRNNFQSNSFDLFTNASRNYNIYDSNYWSSYKGYDLDRNGIGDIPHQPVSLFTYVVERSPASIILMRSMIIGILDLAEKAAPAITPEGLKDMNPLMNPVP
jgi:nitrous oxidase accessory protein